MISIRRILGLLALAGTIGPGAESRAQAQTVQPKPAGVATAVLEIQFARLLLGQEQQSISRETNPIRQQNQALSRLGQLLTQTPETQMAPIVARPPFGGRPPATPFR
jgi:hypothetical protein